MALGMLENERERAEIAKMDLQAAYGLWKEGKLRLTLARYAAQVCECDCGNRVQLMCGQSNHWEMRQSLAYGMKADGETVHEGIISQG